MLRCFRILLPVLLFLPVLSAQATDVKDTDVYARLKEKLDAVPAIDTHSHLLATPQSRKHMLENYFRADPPRGCALQRVWRHSYFTWGHDLARWPKDHSFDTWWKAAQGNFINSRARSAYRAMLPIFTDLYGVDFESLTLDQARELNKQMEENCANPDWAEEVLRRRANTEMMVIDSFVMPCHVRPHYPFMVSVCNVRWLINGFHPSEFKRFPADDPYAFAKKHNLPVETLDDYVNVIDRIMAEAKKDGAICLKSQSAYDRTLKFDWTAKHVAEQAFGKPRKQLKPHQVKAFQDYIFWQLARLAGKNDLPFQIHTGHARIPGSNPMNLVNVISANRKTKFILFHGGFPWVGESGMIALKYPHVWLDSVWMPVLSYNMGKRAYKEWLDMFSSNRIMWGSDMFTIEGSYGATIYTRQCIYEALAEKVIDKELSEKDAARIGRQILRDNALEIFPSLKELVKKPDKD